MQIKIAPIKANCFKVLKMSFYKSSFKNIIYSKSISKLLHLYAFCTIQHGGAGCPALQS